METIEINGKSYLIDIEKATEQGLLKEKDNKPRSWEEYTLSLKNKAYRSTADYDYRYIENGDCPYDAFRTPEELKAFWALGRLIQLRDAWVGDWKPDWEVEWKQSQLSSEVRKYTIICYSNELSICYTIWRSNVLTFPTEEMATDFLSTFRDLIEQAKMFL